MNTQYINLNMVPSGVLPVMHVSQFDIGRPLGVVVYDGSAEMDLDDYTVTIEATRTDGTPITAAVTTDGNIGAFVTTATMTNKDDLYPAQLVIVDGDSNRVASLPFMMRVVKAAMDENSEAIEEDAPLYQQYNAALQALIVAVRAEINAEAATRQAADTTLQNNINAEAAARIAADNTLQANINSEASTRATQDAVLSARMDTFASLPSGSTSGNAELLDIRVDVNGETYPTAGNAVRGQVNDLKSQLYEFNAINLLNAPITSTKNGITWEKISGAKVAVRGTPTSPSIIRLYQSDSALPEWAAVGGTYDYSYSGTNVFFRVMYYDGTDWIQIINTKTSGSFTIPQNAIGLSIRLWVQVGVTDVNEIVEPIILSTSTNKELEENFENYLPITTTTDIQANDDLNDYTTPGTYASRSASVTVTLSNTPDSLTSGAFMLTVIKTIGGTPNTRRIRQFIYAETSVLTAGNVGIYTRTKLTDEIWEPWIEFAGTEYVNETNYNLSIFSSVTAVLVKAINFITDEDGITYGAQGITATDNYIVMGLDAINTSDHPDVARKYNALLILNKSDYSMADLPENPIFRTVSDYEGVETCHMSNLSWDSEAREIYIRTVSGGVNNAITIVIDDSTFAIKRYENLRYPGAFDYDNVTKRWAFNHYNTPAVTDTLRIVSKDLNSVKAYTFARQGTTQGMLYYNGVVFTPSTVAHTNNNIRVTDSNGNLLRDWYFPVNSGAEEFEDLAAISDNKILLSANSNNQYRLFEIIYRAYNTAPDDYKTWDHYINSSIDLGS